MENIVPPPLPPAADAPKQVSPIAGFWRRVLAAVIDFCLLGVFGWILGLSSRNSSCTWVAGNSDPERAFPEGLTCAQPAVGAEKYRANDEQSGGIVILSAAKDLATAIGAPVFCAGEIFPQRLRPGRNADGFGHDLRVRSFAVSAAQDDKKPGANLAKIAFCNQLLLGR